MKKCQNENCDYFREHGECHEICTEQGIAKIITNADRIRAMSDEEMVEWIFRHDTKTICYGRLNREDLLKWLQYEVDLTT